MEKAFKKYGNPLILELKPRKIITKIKDLETAYEGDIQKAHFIYDIFNKGIIDNLSFYINTDVITNDKEDYKIEIYDAILKEKVVNNIHKHQITLKLVLIEFYYASMFKSSRKPIPVPNSFTRTPIPPVITKPFCIEVQFDIIKGLFEDNDIYTPNTLDDYYEEYLQLQVGGKITKKQLIEICKKKQIPYSGLTKVELMNKIRAYKS